MLLNSDPDDGIKLNVWYSKPNRMDVFVDGVYIDPTNARTTASGNYILDTPVGRYDTDLYENIIVVWDSYCASRSH